MVGNIEIKILCFSFIRDVIRYLKDKSDPLKLEIGLNAAEQVVREKTGVGSELSTGHPFTEKVKSKRDLTIFSNRRVSCRVGKKFDLCTRDF